MNTFPHEIWRLIALYIPHKLLQSLIALNSTFFDIAMDSRYRQMSFAYLDNRMLRSLARLKDPSVAKRVRILHVYPGFLLDALERKTEPALKRTLRVRIHELYTLLLEQKFKPHPRLRMMRLLKDTDDVIQMMLQVLSGLPNVTDYYVTWCGPASISAMARPFLSTVFQSNLRKLSLELSLQNAKNLLSIPTFHVQPNLQHLHLSIHAASPPASAEETAHILTSHLAPALSALHPTLRLLSLQSCDPVDLSPLFTTISTHPLPLLEELIISIPIEEIHLGDPRGFSLFLNTHSKSLRTLRLRANQYSGPGLTPNLCSFDDWVRDALGGVRLPKLRTLDISSNLFPVPTSEFCVAHFCAGLTALALTGAYRAYDNVEDALDLVIQEHEHSRGARLKRLRIGLVSLSPQLVDLIAMKLPLLERLELVVKYILPHANDRAEVERCAGHGSPAEGQVTSQIDAFIDTLSTRSYPHWTLQHLSILAESLPYRTTYEPILEQTFLACVPGLRSVS